MQISGSGFAASTKLDITFQSTPKSLGSITSNATGAFATTVTIPSDATAGAHHIVVAGTNTVGGTRTIKFPVTVTTSSTGGSNNGGDTLGTTGGTSNPVSLPRTGLGIAMLFGLALTCVLGGLAGISEARTRRRLARTPDRT